MMMKPLCGGLLHVTKKPGKTKSTKGFAQLLVGNGQLFWVDTRFAGDGHEVRITHPPR
jgi:hypothetical protein